MAATEESALIRIRKVPDASLNKKEDLADGNLTKEEKNHQRRHPADDSNVEIQLADVRIEPWLSTERPHLATIFRRSPD